MTDFGELYKKYAPDVFRFALYLTGERSEAEDIMSETFVRAWTSPEAIRAALLMRANEGLTYEEISQVMGLSLASVKVKIHRARLALLKMRQV